jgi:putative holliday junction resolvase
MAFNEEVPRVLGIDYGHKRIGFALSDPFGLFATGLETLEDCKPSAVVSEIVKRVQQHKVETVVLGLPLNMNGSEGPKAVIIRELAEVLTQALPATVSLHLLDERLTSVLAHQTLQAQGIAPSRHKGAVDQAAAKRILQDFLDRRSTQAASALTTKA